MIQPHVSSRHGFRLDHFERKRKKEARAPHELAQFEKKAFGLKAKLHHKKRHQEKAVMRKTIAMHQQRENKHKDEDVIPSGAVPAYLLDREGVSRAKVLSNTVKQKRKEKAGKWAVPLPAVRPIAEEEVFKVVKSGKRKKKAWKRMITKMTFVGQNFTRKPPKPERFIRPTGLRVITKGTVIEVNVSDLGLVTPSGKVVWGKYAQVTNNPELDGCVNAVLLV